MEHSIGNSKNNSVNGKARKDERRTACYARLDQFNELSLKQKLAAIPPDGGNRQRARYEAQLSKIVEREKHSVEAKKERTLKAAEKLVKEKQGK